MKRGRTVDDPAWNRSKPSTSKKKSKMCSRASLRLLSTLIRKKKAVDKRKAKTVCATRTVELSSAEQVGDESSKLLFALALGLLPNYVTKPHSPVVKLERLDPAVEAKAKARTRDVIYQIFQKRKLESLQRRIFQTNTPQRVEVVDLISSEDESATSSDESDAEPVIIKETYRFANPHNLSLHASHHSVSTNPQPPYGILSCSTSTRSPVFKPLGNNSQSGIFRNWNPESMTKLINMPTNKTNSIQLFKGSESYLSSLKSTPTTTTAVVTVSDVSTKVSQGSKCQPRGVFEKTSSSSVSSDFNVPDALITID